MTLITPHRPRMPRARAALTILALSCSAFGAAAAPPPVILSTPTDLTSSVDRMISYRQQEHMWQTADGALHVMINRGRQSTTVPGLALYSSFDGGTTWLPMLSWGNAGIQSTADGTLIGNELSIVYSTLRGGIVYARLLYDAGQHAWTMLNSETVYGIDGQNAQNPSVAVDTNGIAWAAFVSTTTATAISRTLLYKREPGAPAWSDSGQVFGTLSSDSDAQSPRLIAMPDSMAILVKVYDTLYWATRSNAAPPTAPWLGTTIFVSPPPAPRDPNGSHFSVIADPQNNLHMVMADDTNLLYFKYQSSSGAWSTARSLDRLARVSYCQISLVDGNTLAVVYNNSSAESRVMKSIDQGSTFTSAAQLSPVPEAGATYSFSRVETPSISRQPLPVLRQYEYEGAQRLMLFNVPLP